MLSPPPNLPGRSVRVLLVDDDTELGELVREYLPREDFTLEVEADGTHAVDRALAGDYRLICARRDAPRRERLRHPPSPSRRLAELRVLEVEAREQEEAVKAARRSLALTTNQYRAGVVSYLNVVIAQTAALTSEQTAVGITGRRLGASVLLIKALGGGWSADRLPTDSEVTHR